MSLSLRAVEKINSGRCDLTNDLPMDVVMQGRPTARETSDDFDLAFAENGESRFKDVDLPSALFD